MRHKVPESLWRQDRPVLIDSADLNRWVRKVYLRLRQAVRLGTMLAEAEAGKPPPQGKEATLVKLTDRMHAMATCLVKT